MPSSVAHKDESTGQVIDMDQGHLELRHALSGLVAKGPLGPLDAPDLGHIRLEQRWLLLRCLERKHVGLSLNIDSVSKVSSQGSDKTRTRRMRKSLLGTSLGAVSWVWMTWWPESMTSRKGRPTVRASSKRLMPPMVTTSTTRFISLESIVRDCVNVVPIDLPLVATQQVTNDCDETMNAPVAYVSIADEAVDLVVCLEKVLDVHLRHLGRLIARLQTAARQRHNRGHVRILHQPLEDPQTQRPCSASDYGLHGGGGDHGSMCRRMTELHREPPLRPRWG